MSKHIFAFLLMVISITICININTTKAYTIAEITKIKDPKKQLELTLQLPLHANKDTTILKKTLAPLLDYAEEHKNILLKWAYYMQMADGFSVAFDSTNDKSNHYYQLANRLVKQHNLLELEMVGLIREGYYHFVYRNVTSAFPFFLQANDLKDKIIIEKMPLPVVHYQFLASFYSYIGDYNTSIAYLQQVLPLSPAATRIRVNLMNSLALYNEKLNNKGKAIGFFNDALQEAKLAKDSVWIGIISGNLSSYAWQNGDKPQAIQLLKQNIELSLRYNETHDAMRANLKLAEYYIYLNQWTLAEQYVQRSKGLMENKPYYLQYQMDAAHSLSQIAKGMNNKLQELNYLNQYLSLRDSLEKRTNIQEMQKIIWQNEKDKYQSSIQYAEDKRSQRELVLLAIVLFGILAFCVILLLVQKSKSRIKIKNAILEKKQLTLSYEKKLLDQEVSVLKNSLEDFTYTIKQNDAVIKQLRLDIASVPKQYDQQMQSFLDQLNSMLDAHIMTDERWIKFKTVFDKVYPGYLNQTKENFEKITENDLKILALQKLDLSNSSMSEMLCVSVEGVKKAKQRLKKKLEMTNIQRVDLN